MRAADSLTGSNYGATINNYTAGYDYALSRRLVIGLSIAASDSSANTYFNNGHFSGKGYVAAPYVSYELNKNWSADASAGWGQGNQTTAAFGANASGGVDRTFAAANLNGTYWYGRGHWFGHPLFGAQRRGKNEQPSPASAACWSRKSGIPSPRPPRWPATATGSKASCPTPR